MKACIFPGQGSQRPRMGKELYESFPEARDIYDRARVVSGIDWAEISFEGDRKTLSRTENTQPCLFLHCAALLHSMGSAVKFDGVAGHSLGEYSALYAANILDFEDVLKNVIERGKLMSEAESGGMLALLGADDGKVERVVESLKKYGVITVANYNAPGQLIVSGETGILEKASGLLKDDAGARKVVNLPVSGAFHSPLMEDAREAMSSILNRLEFRSPKVCFYSNTSGKREEDPNRIRELLISQITSPVRWIREVRAMYSDGFGTFVEVGPGRVLQGLVGRILDDVEIAGISNAEDIKELRP